MQQAPFASPVSNWNPLTQIPPSNAWDTPFSVGGQLSFFNKPAQTLLNSTYKNVPASRGLFDWLQRRPEEIGVRVAPASGGSLGFYMPTPEIKSGGLIQIDPRQFLSGARQALVHEGGHAADFLRYPNWSNPQHPELAAWFNTVAPEMAALYPPRQWGMEGYTRQIVDNVFGPRSAHGTGWTGSPLAKAPNWGDPTLLQRIIERLRGTGKYPWLRY